ncbi:hypothetical protein ACFL3T_04715, partial [Patescibacteria group bacterium]
PDSVLPAEVIKTRGTTSEKVNEAVWSADRQGDIVYMDSQYAALEKRQREVQSMLNNGEVPDAPIDHEKIGKKLTEIQISQANAQGKLAEAKLKAEHTDDLAKISKYNQERLKGYTEVVSDGSKSLLTKLGEGTGTVISTVGKGVGEGGLAVGKAALKLTGKGLKIGAKAGRAVIGELVQLGYDIADIHSAWRKRNPKSID